MKTHEKYLIKEATYTAGYSDSVIAQDDDFPTGNILMGDKYKKIGYDNKLTSFNTNWVPDDSEWTWNEFDAAKGQGSKNSYHDTLKSFFLTDRLFKHMHKGPPEEVPKTSRTLGNDLGPDTDAWGQKDKFVKTADVGDLDQPDEKGEPDVPDDEVKDITEKIELIIGGY